MSKIVAHNDGGDCSKNQELSSESPITHVIFEFYGLFMDTTSMYDRAICQMMKNYGKTLTNGEKNFFLGHKPWPVADYLIQKKRLHLDEDEFASEFKQEYLKILEEQPPRLMPGAERLIRHLYRSGIPMAIISNNERDMFEMNTKPHQSLMKLFHHVVLPGDYPEVTKRKPESYTVCANRFDQPPKNLKNVLLFGGFLDSIYSAHCAGMATVYVQDDDHFDGDITKYKLTQLKVSRSKPDLIIDSLESFKPQVFGLPSFC